jgi:hypothetical protein
MGTIILLSCPSHCIGKRREGSTKILTEEKKREDVRRALAALLRVEISCLIEVVESDPRQQQLVAL